MATRRPRVKPAAILKPRRPQTLAGEQSGNEAIKVELKGEEQLVEPKSAVDSTANDAIEEPIPVAKSPVSDVKAIKTPEASETTENVATRCEATENKPPEASESKQNLAAPTSIASNVPKPTFRRITKPHVNIVSRRKSLIATENRPFPMSSPLYSHAYDGKFKETRPNASPRPTRLNTPAAVDDDVFSPVPPENDECFKSPPFMSPSIYSRRADPSMSPFHDIYNDDYAKSPSSNMKIRQRIRPTPCFASRRNSIQGSNIGVAASESEDEQHRRQRHYSTSSSHSNYNSAAAAHHQRSFFGLNKANSRVRTESYSSSVSDAPNMRDFNLKMKRSHRSEEYQRVANAKREFNQRLNGKPPDKSRLTMYDLIYYNPLTNPMSKPAGKGDKTSDTASLSSAKTVQSRSSGSVKSESSSSGNTVKAEHPEPPASEPMPVPQLKLGANGEIVLDEKSLVIETTGEKEAREILANSDVVYDDEFSGTSGFYKRQKRTRDWLPLETIKFYRSLQTIGTDFSVMLQLFPNRSRRDLKLKFKKEEKYNMALINKALLHPKEFNVDELKLQFDKEDEEIELKKQEWAEIRKKMSTDRKEHLNTSKKRNPSKQVSFSMRSLTDGDAIYENEFVKLPKMRRTKRKRTTSANIPEDSTKPSSSSDPLFSPAQLNHNNNHVDPLPSHTYATHKLPDFTQMITSTQKKKTPRENPHPIALHSNNMISNGMNASSSIETIDDSVPVSLVVHRRNCADSKESTAAVHGSNGSNQVFVNDPKMDRFIAKNPNLTFKGDSDIMNMDIIFDNVSIEEDETITANTSHIPSTEIVETSVSAVAQSQIERVDIDGVQYEIITLNNTNNQAVPIAENSLPNGSDENVINIDNSAPSNEEVRTDTVHTTVASGEKAADQTENAYDQYMYNEDGVVIMSVLDVAAEVEATDEASEVSNVWQETETASIFVPEQSESNEIQTDESIYVPNATENLVEDSRENNECSAEDEKPSETNNQTEQSGEKRSAAPQPIRKRKPPPCLVSRNKRPRPEPTVQKSVVEKSTSKIVSEEEETAKQPESKNVVAEPSPELKGDSSSDIDVPTTNEAALTDDDHQQPPPSENQSNEENTSGDINDSGQNVDPDEDEEDADAKSQKNSFMDSLVVVESQDPHNPSKTIHEVYVMCPKTNKMSEKPLDLPDDVVQQIRMASD